MIAFRDCLAFVDPISGKARHLSGKVDNDVKQWFECISTFKTIAATADAKALSARHLSPTKSKEVSDGTRSDPATPNDNAALIKSPKPPVSLIGGFSTSLPSRQELADVSTETLKNDAKGALGEIIESRLKTHLPTRVALSSSSQEESTATSSEYNRSTMHKRVSVSVSIDPKEEIKLPVTLTQDETPNKRTKHNRKRWLQRRMEKAAKKKSAWVKAYAFQLPGKPNRSKNHFIT